MADGQYILACIKDGVGNESSNSGTDWSQTLSSAAYYAADLDYTGLNGIVCVYNGRVYKKTAGTWAEIKPAGDASKQWRTACISRDGSRWYVAGADYGYSYLWNGTSYSCSYTNRSIYSSAMNKNGAVMIAGGEGARLWVVTNNTTWTEVRPAGDANRNWVGVDISYDGTKMVACSKSTSATQGRIWLSTDSGTNWAELRPAGDADKNWSSVRMNKDGTVFIACFDDESTGRVYISTDSGANWTLQTPGGYATGRWTNVGTDATGDNFFAMMYNGVFATKSGTTWSKTLYGDTGKTWGYGAFNKDDGSFDVGSTFIPKVVMF